jgi:hypothetical protein
MPSLFVFMPSQIVKKRIYRVGLRPVRLGQMSEFFAMQVCANAIESDDSDADEFSNQMPAFLSEGDLDDSLDLPVDDPVYEISPNPAANLCTDVRPAIFANCLSTEEYPLQQYSQDSGLGQYRRCLIGWIVRTSFDLSLCDETIALAVAIFDRGNVRKRQAYQLGMHAAAALWMAAKMEEYRPPTVLELMFMGGNAYTEEQLADCESELLEPLSASITCPDPLFYLSTCSREAAERVHLFALAALFHEDYPLTEPSVIAAAVMHMVDPATLLEWPCDAIKVKKCTEMIAVSVAEALDDIEHPLCTLLTAKTPRNLADKFLPSSLLLTTDPFLIELSDGDSSSSED